MGLSQILAHYPEKHLMEDYCHAQWQSGQHHVARFSVQ